MRVYSVLADRSNLGEGPAGDGVHIFRFRSRREARDFARNETCYGKPATVSVDEVPNRIATRWLYHGGD